MSFGQHKAGILLNYINEAVKILTTLIYTPVMLRLLGQSEYGLYQMVGAIVANLSLLSFGFGSAYVRYFYRYRTKQDDRGIARLNGMFLLIFCAVAAICLACGLVMRTNAVHVFGDGLTAGELEKARILLLILTVNMAVTFPNSVFDCYVTAHERFFFQKLLRLAQSVLNPFLTLPLLMMGYGSVSVVMVTTILTFSTFFVNIYYCVRKLRMAFSFRKLQFSLLWEMWVFTFFIFLNQIIDQINWNVDKFLLGRISGTKSVAVYGVGAQINNMYIQMSVAISSIFVPRVNRIVAESDDETELTRLMSKVGRMQLAVLALILSGFILWGRDFLQLWVGDGYSVSYYVALLLLIPVTVPLIQNLGIEIQRAKNLHKVRSAVYTGLAVCNVLLSIVLIRLWDSVGAAAGTAISMILGNILFMNWYYHRKMKLDMVAFWREIVKMMPAILLAVLWGLFFRQVVVVRGWISLLLCVLVYTAGYGISMWLLGWSREEKHGISDFLKRMHEEKHNDCQ